MTKQPTVYILASRRNGTQKDDIVYAIRGSIGAAELVPAHLEGANLTQDAARIAPGDGICSRWLLYMVRSRSFFSKLEAGAVRATIRGINIRDLKRTDLSVPPFDEQKAIALHLDQMTLDVEKAVDRARREIDLIREYRTRLISDVVTGKLDVRGVELPEPDAGEAGVEASPDGLGSLVAVGLTDPEEVLDAER